MNSTINKTVSYFMTQETFKTIVIIIFVLSLVFNGIQGYYYYKKVKINKDLQGIIDTKSNCEVAPPAVETPEETPATTPARRYNTNTTSDEEESSDSGASDSSSGDSQETVVPPPPPPSD